MECCMGIGLALRERDNLFCDIQAVYKAEEEKKVLLTELGHASLELEKTKQHKVQPSKQA